MSSERVELIERPARRMFHIELSRLSTKMTALDLKTPMTPSFTPMTPSFTPLTPTNPMALNELKSIFSDGPTSPLFPPTAERNNLRNPIPERNVRNRKPSFLFNQISQKELLAPFKPIKEE